jgi:hypothetical protein
MPLASFRFLSIHTLCTPAASVAEAVGTPNSIHRFPPEPAIGFALPDPVDAADAQAAALLASRQRNRETFSVGFDASHDHFFARLDDVVIERASLRGHACFRIFIDRGVALSEPYQAHYKADWPAMRTPDAVHLQLEGEAVPVYLHEELDVDVVIDEPVLSLLDKHAANYYHWMCEVLPRLQAREADAGLAAAPVLVNDTARSAFHAQTLAALGARPLMPFRWRRARFKTLYVPSFLTSGEVARRLRPAFAWLRQRLGPTPAGDRPRRLYVSRDDAGQRRVANDAEVAAALAGLGFARVTLAGRSVAEQLDLFAGAEAIVLPHGAAGANLAAASPGTLVVECQPASLLNPSYWMLARA